MSQPLVILARLLTAVLPELQKVFGHTPRPKRLTVKGIACDGYVFPETRNGQKMAKVLAPFLESLGPLTTVAAMYERLQVDLYLPPIKEGDLVITGLDKFEDNAERGKAQSAIIFYKPHLELLARILGRPVEFHMKGPDCVPPWPESDPAVRILTGANPPGEHSLDWLREAYGMPIHEKLMWAQTRTGTRGRGTILVDEQKKAMVQILNSTAYLLIPVINCYHNPGSSLIFKKLVGQIGTALYEQERKKLSSVEENPARGAIMQVIEKAPLYVRDHWQGKAKTAEQEIVDLGKKLNGKIQELREIQALLETFDKTMLPEATKQGRRDVPRLRKHPLIERLYACDEGVHADTRQILAEHEGKWHRLGTFTIRLSQEGVVSLWGKEITHPDGVPHPHLRKHGDPCFGNATEAIIRAGAEMRVYDAFDFVLRWLKEGYDPKLATTPIAEWPTQEVPA